MSEVLRVTYEANFSEELSNFSEVVRSSAISDSIFTFLGLGTLEIFVRGRVCSEFSDQVVGVFQKTLAECMSFAQNEEDQVNFNAIQVLANLAINNADRVQVNEWIHEHYMKNSFENAPWRLTQVFKRMSLSIISSGVIKKEIEESNIKPNSIKSILNTFSNKFKICIMLYKSGSFETVSSSQPGQYPIIYLQERPSSEFCLLRHKAQLSVDHNQEEAQNLLTDHLTYTKPPDDSSGVSYVLPRPNPELPKPQDPPEIIVNKPFQDLLNMKNTEIKLPENIKEPGQNNLELQKTNKNVASDVESRKTFNPFQSSNNSGRPEGENKAPVLPFAPVNKKIEPSDINSGIFRGAEVKKVASPAFAPSNLMGFNKFPGENKPVEIQGAGLGRQEHNMKVVQEMYNAFKVDPDNSKPAEHNMKVVQEMYNAFKVDPDNSKPEEHNKKVNQEMYNAFKVNPDNSKLTEHNKKVVQEMYNAFKVDPDNPNPGINMNLNQPGPIKLNFNRNNNEGAEPFFINNVGPVKIPSNNEGPVKVMPINVPAVNVGNPVNIPNAPFSPSNIGPANLNKFINGNLVVSNDRNSAFPKINQLAYPIPFANKGLNNKPDQLLMPNVGPEKINPPIQTGNPRPLISNHPFANSQIIGANAPVKQIQQINDQNKGILPQPVQNIGKANGLPAKDLIINNPKNMIPNQPVISPVSNGLNNLYQSFMSNAPGSNQMNPINKNISNQSPKLPFPDFKKNVSEEPKKPENPQLSQFAANFIENKPEPKNVIENPAIINNPGVQNIKNPEPANSKVPSFYSNFTNNNLPDLKPPVLGNLNPIQNIPQSPKKVPFQPNIPVKPDPVNLPQFPMPPGPPTQAEEKLKYSVPHIDPNIQIDKNLPHTNPNNRASEVPGPAKSNADSNAPNFINDLPRNTVNNPNPNLYNIPNPGSRPPNNPEPLPKFNYPRVNVPLPDSSNIPPKNPLNLEINPNKPAIPEPNLPGMTSDVSYNLPKAVPETSSQPHFPEKKFSQKLPEIPPTKNEPRPEKPQIPPNERSMYEETIQFLSDAILASNSKSPQLLQSLDMQCKKFPYLRNLKSISSLLIAKPLGNIHTCAICRKTKELEDFNIISCGDVNKCQVCTICRIETMNNGCPSCTRSYSDYEMQNLGIAKSTI